jgi:hypothetical protein
LYLYRLTVTASRVFLFLLSVLPCLFPQNINDIDFSRLHLIPMCPRLSDL